MIPRYGKILFYPIVGVCGVGRVLPSILVVPPGGWRVVSLKAEEAICVSASGGGSIHGGPTVGMLSTGFGPW